MSLDDTESVDAIGTEIDTGNVVLSIVDSWTWDDEEAHMLALQAKLNAYFEFIEGGQIFEAYPGAQGRSLVIDVLWREAPPPNALALLERAREASVGLAVTIRGRHVPEP